MSIEIRERRVRIPPDLDYEDLAKEDLKDLYELALEEYRFQVQYNWSRTRFYFLLNTAILGAASGLLRVEGDRFSQILLSLLFFVGFLTSALGVLAIGRGKEYYRSTVVKKTVLEDLLGLTDEVPGYDDTNHRLAVGTTRGMEKIESILNKPEWYSRERGVTPGSITFYIMVILGVIGLLDLFGMIYVLAGLLA